MPTAANKPSHEIELIDIFINNQALKFTANEVGEIVSCRVVKNILLDFVSNVELTEDGTTNIINWIRVKSPLSSFSHSAIEFIIRFYRFQRVEVDGTLIRKVAKRSLRATAPKFPPSLTKQMRDVMLAKSKGESRSFLSSRTNTIVFLLLHLPFRRSTLCQLHLSDYDSANKTLKIASNQIKTRSPLIIDLSDSICEKLDSYIKFRGNGPGYLFPKSKAGDYMQPESLSKQIKRVSENWFIEEKIPINGLSTHAFRHLVATFASTYIDEGTAKAVLTINSDKTLRFYNLSTGGMRASAGLRRMEGK
jgi:integrase